MHPSEGICCPRMPLAQTRAQPVASSVGQRPSAHLADVGALRPRCQEVQELLGIVQLMACLHPTNTRDSEAGGATCNLCPSPAHLGPDESASAPPHAPALLLLGRHARHRPAPAAAPARCRLRARLLLAAGRKLEGLLQARDQGCAFELVHTASGHEGGTHMRAHGCVAPMTKGLQTLLSALASCLPEADPARDESERLCRARFGVHGSLLHS